MLELLDTTVNSFGEYLRNFVMGMDFEKPKFRAVENYEGYMGRNDEFEYKDGRDFDVFSIAVSFDLRNIYIDGFYSRLHFSYVDGIYSIMYNRKTGIFSNWDESNLGNEFMDFMDSIKMITRMEYKEKLFSIMEFESSKN